MLPGGTGWGQGASRREKLVCRDAKAAHTDTEKVKLRNRRGQREAEKSFLVASQWHVAQPPPALPVGASLYPGAGRGGSLSLALEWSLVKAENMARIQLSSSRGTESLRWLVPKAR